MPFLIANNLIKFSAGSGAKWFWWRATLAGGARNQPWTHRPEDAVGFESLPGHRTVRTAGHGHGWSSGLLPGVRQLPPAQRQSALQLHLRHWSARMHSHVRSPHFDDSGRNNIGSSGLSSWILPPAHGRTLRHQCTFVTSGYSFSHFPFPLIFILSFVCRIHGNSACWNDDRLVFIVSIKAVCLTSAYGAPASACCIPLCTAVRGVCSDYDILKCIFFS